jgi:hypothetical protein
MVGKYYPAAVPAANAGARGRAVSRGPISGIPIPLTGAGYLHILSPTGDKI